MRKRRQKLRHRTRSGRLSRAGVVTRDHGTPELQAKRLALVNGSADPVLSSSLAGIMLAHEIITPEQHQAAQRYRALRAALYGAVLPRVESMGPAPDSGRILLLQREFNRIVVRLSVEQKATVTDLALDLRRPWLVRQLLGRALAPNDQHERRDLIEALDAIGP
jgi:hypothetical protein